MSDSSKALVMVGSPKPGDTSASGSLGGHIGRNLAQKGYEVETVRTNQAMRAAESMRALLASFDRASLVVLVFPLYIDSLPAGLTKTLELIAKHRLLTAASGSPGVKKQRMLALCQSGFPEAKQCATALSICRLFCRDVGVEWAGGLALGGGGFVDGRELEQMGGMVRNLVKGLDLACSDIAAGKPVSHEAVELVAKPMMPRWMYLMGGGYGWRRAAKKNGTTARMRDKPYER